MPSLSEIIPGIVAKSLTGSNQYPDSPSWPTPSEWSSLNTTLNGNLIKAVPAASPCYPGPTQSRASCLTAKAVRALDDPVMVRTAWFGGFACDAVYSNGSASEVGGGECGLGNYPVFVVKAMSKEDVSAGVRFAQKYGLRLVVKNTGYVLTFLLRTFQSTRECGEIRIEGLTFKLTAEIVETGKDLEFQLTNNARIRHDFLGRNLGYGSLSIWTHKLRGIEFKESWNPSIGPSLDTNQSAVVFGSGIQWRELYGAAYRANKTVVGGADPVSTQVLLLQRARCSPVTSRT
jgi:hypothetical protein